MKNTESAGAMEQDLKADLVQLAIGLIGLLSTIPAYLVFRFAVGLTGSASIFWAAIVGVMFFVLGEAVYRFLIWRSSGCSINKTKLVAWLLYGPIIGICYVLLSNLGIAVFLASIIVVCVWVVGHTHEWIMRRRSRV